MKGGDEPPFFCVLETTRGADQAPRGADLSRQPQQGRRAFPGFVPQWRGCKQSYERVLTPVVVRTAPVLVHMDRQGELYAMCASLL